MSIFNLPISPPYSHLKMDSHSTPKEVTTNFPGLIRVYRDGSVERLWNSPFVPPSPDDPETGVASKDITISTHTGLSARLYLPKPTQKFTKLPILVYFHGGGFCTESAFSTLTNRYMNILASISQALIVSIEYRLAPEHPLPIAYEDCWEAVNWVASQPDDPWLSNHGDITALFIGGDSSGANIAHNIAMKAGYKRLNHDVKILGAFICQAFFLDEKIKEVEVGYKIWEFVYPNAIGGSDSPMLNPMTDGGPSLGGLGCLKVLVIASGSDVMKGSGVRYYNKVRGSGFKGQVEIFEIEEEGHGFHVFSPDSEKANLLFQRLASFMTK